MSKELKWLKFYAQIALLLLIYTNNNVVTGKQASKSDETSIQEKFTGRDKCGQGFPCGRKCTISATISFPVIPNLLFLTISLEIYKDNFGQSFDETKLDFTLVHNDNKKLQYKIPSKDVDFDSTSSNSLVTVSLLFIKLQKDDNEVDMNFDTTVNFCGKFKDIFYYYYECPEDGSDILAKFPKDLAPAEGLTVIDGKCLDNAVPLLDVPQRKCWFNGTYEDYNPCVCDIGYEFKDNTCQACQGEYFKEEKGNGNCILCGANSEQNGNQRCVCLAGYARTVEDTEKKNTPCYELPQIFNLQQTATSNSIHLRWENKKNTSGYYEVECTQCPGNDWPKVIGKDTEMIIYGLDPFTVYNITVVMKNNVTEATKQSMPIIQAIKTNPGVPTKVLDLKDQPGEDGAVVISWKPPRVKGAEKIFYRVEYSGKLIDTMDPQHVITADVESKSYDVEVTAVSQDGSNIFIGPATVYHVTVDGKGVPLSIVLGGIGAAIAFLLVFIILFIVIWKKKHPAHLQIYRMEDGTVQLQRNRLFSTGRVYVDPTTYSVVDDAVYDFTLELSHKNLSMSSLIGHGEFADVYKGILTKNGVESIVAVKTLKSNATQRDRDDFVSEAAILGQFNDTNVVSLDGVILKDYPNVLVLEYMANGSLDKYLQSNDGKFSIMTLLGMARGVASGMKYLSELGFIHRDLAARNVLVNKNDICKIADFGMSRELKTDETYDTRGGKIPIKWTAPEAIEFKKFTTASDVWSYGIVLWEIMSYGVRPYWNWANYEVLERLATGYRLPPPLDCPKVVHDLMLLCWHKDRTKRPRFITVRESIEEWIRYPDLLKDFASVVNKADEDIDYSSFQTIEHLLESIKMSQYTKCFTDKGYSTPKDIILLQLEDLEDIGIETLGHRKKIHKAVRRTRQQVEGTRSVSRSSSSATTMELTKVKRTSSSAGALKSAISKKLSFGVTKHTGYDKSSLNKHNNGYEKTMDGKTTLTKKSSFSCV